ncbi:MAG: carbon-nitrogen hydrolase family protein [Sphaerochaeta sp.]
MKIAQIQMKVVSDKNKNIDRAVRYIEDAAKNNADLIMLPEMFSCPYETEQFPIYAEKDGAHTWKMLSDAAKANHIYLIAGSIAERDADDTYNTSYVFDRDGTQIAKHRKMHLFDIDIKDGQTFKESDSLKSGDQVTCFDTEFGRFGLMICFDIRFTELSRLMALDGAVAVFVPAAFNMTTGPAHWQLLFRARALDNQSYYIGTSSARDMSSSYHSYGHSIITSPWGDVISMTDEKEQIIYSTIDLKEVKDIREQLPILKSRRYDIYNLSKSII